MLAVICPAGYLALFVFPMGSDTILSNAVHLVSPYLDLERLTVIAEHCRMYRLIHIRLRHRDIVFEAPRYRHPPVMDEPQRRITVFDAAYEYSYGKDIEYLIDLFVLHLHFAVDAVEMLSPALYFVLYAGFIKLGRDLSCKGLEVFIVFDLFLGYSV